MSKFRKKPVVIEAVQFWPDAQPWPEGVSMYQPPDTKTVNRSTGEVTTWVQDPYPAIQTLEGVMRVREGDWVITGVQGEKYPCQNDIFEATYEAVRE